MVKLTKIKFQDERGKEVVFNIQTENQISFDYVFEMVEEEIVFAGGYMLALPKSDIKAFLESKDESKKLKMKSFGFETAKGEKWFQIPASTSFTFQKVDKDDQKSADFAGTVFIKLISSEITK